MWCMIATSPVSEPVTVGGVGGLGAGFLAAVFLAIVIGVSVSFVGYGGYSSGSLIGVLRR